MIWNVIFIALWLSTRKKETKWRKFWMVLGVINLVLLAWNVFALLLLFSQI